MSKWSKEKWLSIAGSEPTNLNELFSGILAVLQHEAQSCDIGAEVDGLAWEIKYSPTVSNTHSCPLNGVENWHGDNNKPRSYPGFAGRVWVRYSASPKSFSGSEIFSATGLYTGTGGYGSYQGPWAHIHKIFTDHTNYANKSRSRDSLSMRTIYPMSWDCKLFIEDWPEILENVDQLRTLASISNEKFELTSNMFWESGIASKDDERVEQLLQAQLA